MFVAIELLEAMEWCEKKTNGDHLSKKEYLLNFAAPIGVRMHIYIYMVLVYVRTRTYVGESKIHTLQHV